MTFWVDSYHASEFPTHQLWMSYLIFLNGYSIYWFSKKVPSVEMINFGAEFCAIKQATEYIRGICYMLRVMGLPCDEPTYVYGDNKSILSNTSAPAFQLKKNSNSIAYHFVRE